MKYLKIGLILFACHALAKEQNYNFNSFEEAKKSEEFLSFTGESTKFKIITTNFTGFVKKFNLQYDLNSDQMTKMRVTIDTKSIDTDNSSRNEKLYNLCLKTDNFPQLTVVIDQKLKLIDGQEAQVDAVLTIKDKTFTRLIKFKVTKLAIGYKISFTSDFSLKEASIDDPSIIIAKVNDLFQLSGAVILKP